jgi:hypothetical protein
MRSLILACLMLVCALACAQAPSNAVSTGGSSAPAQAANQPIKLGDVTFTGSVRLRGNGWNWFKPISPTAENEYGYSGNLVRLNFAERLSKWDWDVEFFIPSFFGLPTGATQPAPQGAMGLGSNFFSSNHSDQNTAMIFPKQLFVRFDGLGGDGNHTLQLGRFIVNDGTETVPENATLATLKPGRIGGRLLGEFGFAESGRAFDGVRYSYSKSRNNFTFIGAVPTRGVFQVDGWGWNRVSVQYAAYTRDWGSAKHVADTRAFFLEYEDFRDGILKTDNRPAAVRRADTQHIRVDTYGGHTLHAITTDAGTVDLLAWGAVQTGSWGNQAQRGWSIVGEGGFQPKILPMLKPWVRAGFRDGSGDSNPNDGTHNTFFEVLSGPRPFARTPFFDGTNIQDLYGHLILRPHPKVTTSSEFHSLRLAEANDFWYTGGGVYQPWSFGYTGRATSGRRSLANFYDTNVEYRANRKLTLTGYFGYMQGLGAIEVIYPDDKNGRYGYGEILYRF